MDMAEIEVPIEKSDLAQWRKRCPHGPGTRCVWALAFDAAHLY